MVYIDHNASSPLRPCAKDALMAALAECGNASSIHAAGRRARARVERAREQLAQATGSVTGSVIFTSGGSEANALALRGAVYGALDGANRLTRLLISEIEHESIRANAAALAEAVPGLKVKHIPVTKEGVIDQQALSLELMKEKGRVLVSVMAANNETGVVQEVPTIGRLVRAQGGQGALFHVDAVQAFGRFPVSFADWGADYMTLSAHKIGGPQGAGALIVKEGVPLTPIIAGGGQELGRRSGTENVAAIAGFGAAAESVACLPQSLSLASLRDEFEAQLRRLAPDVVIFGAHAPRLPNTSNFAIPGLSAETALIALDLDGVAVSSGSACSSGKVKPSHVLAAMGVDRELARCGLRVSFGWTSKNEDVDAIIASLRRLIVRRAAMAA